MLTAVALALLGSPLPPVVGAPPASATVSDALEDAERWLKDYRRGRLRIEPGSDDFDRYEELLADQETLRASDPEADRPVLVVLLDLAGFGLEPDAFSLSQRTKVLLEREGFDMEGSARRVRRAAELRILRAVGREAQSAVVQWLVREVVVLRRSHPLERRIAALRIATQRPDRETLLAMLSVARDEADELRPFVLEELTGWSDPLVDAFLFELFRERLSEGDASAFAELVEHLQRLPRPLNESTQIELLKQIAELSISEDWRDASRAVELSGELVTEAVIVPLIEAFEVWLRRGKEEPGRGARRVQEEIHRALQTRSGMSIGRNPDAWRSWWRAVEAGKAELRTGSERKESFSSATFFGLRPVSDQVWFIIDRSTSMTNRLGTSSTSLYDEAIRQLMAYMESSGRDTRYGVTLFSTETLTWRQKLTWANERNLKATRKWLEKNPPSGGTRLRPAVQEVLRLDREGMPDLRALEADTIVVLCDGETSQGSAWVEPFLERVNADARVVFHCVLIGHRGDGTLEALAEHSGGRFTRWN